MAWDKEIPNNSEKLINFPLKCRNNWDALELGTDSELLINNVKVSSSAAIKESKILFSGTGHTHTGGTDGKLINIFFVAGDLLISSVVTARSGWTNISATYSDKFMRINTTPLSTGGAVTHAHTLSEANMPSHVHGGSALNVSTLETLHKHTVDTFFGGVGGTYRPINVEGYDYYDHVTSESGGAHTHSISGNTAATGSGTEFTGSNIPAYVQTTLFKKD